MSIRPPYLRLFVLLTVLAIPPLAAPPVAAGEEPSAKLVRVTYQVADLVIPIPGTIHTPGDSVSAAVTSATQEGHLIKLITDTVDPRSWSDMGGPGAIDYHPMTMSLVVNQTPAIQEQIQDLLRSLRRLQDQQVSLEVRFLSVGEDFVERIGLETKGGVEIKPASPSGPGLRGHFLDDAQVSRLMEAVQGDQHANVMQTPKATVFNGQSWDFDAAEPKSFVTGLQVLMGPDGKTVFQPTIQEIPVGTHLTARPVISADRRSVNVSLNVRLTSLEKSVAETTPFEVSYTPTGEAPKAFTQLLQQPPVSQLSLDRALNIPAGRTALISGWKREREVRTESGPPVLSEIPYVNRLFKNVGYHRETECVMMLVTPRIIIVEEEERPAGAVRQAGFTEEAAPACGKRAEAAELVAKYHRACAEGRGAEATQLAVRALAIDPKCFHVEETPAAPCNTSAPKGR